MPRISDEELEARREEIIDACAALYDAETYPDITMTQIADRVSFGRANVYNYFTCKDEVLLALLQREHAQWTDDLDARARKCGEGAAPASDQLARALAGSLAGRARMLKLLAMNIYDMEHNSRTEQLVAFKHVYGRLLESVRMLVRMCEPAWAPDDIERFVYAFMPFLHGVYPYVFHSEKQRAAMEQAGLFEPELTIEGIVYACARALSTGCASGARPSRQDGARG